MSPKQAHRDAASSAIGGLAEIQSELRRVRRQIADLPTYSKCNEQQEEAREVLDRRETRLENERDELLAVVLMHGVLAISAPGEAVR